MEWKLINMRVSVDVLERIDGAAHDARLTRTAYMVSRSDPGQAGREAIRVTVAPETIRDTINLITPEDKRRLPVGPVPRAPGSMLKVRK